MDNDTKFNKIKQLMDECDSYRKQILSFDRNSQLTDFVRIDPIESGVYLTIRIGLSGIYQIINIWKNGHWDMDILDDSITIARTRNPIKLKTI